VRLAHKFAMENELIRADAIEASEFAELASQYRVYAVPKTVVNHAAFIDGALPEELFLGQVLNTLPPSVGAAGTSLST